MFQLINKVKYYKYLMKIIDEDSEITLEWLNTVLNLDY